MRGRRRQLQQPSDDEPLEIDVGYPGGIEFEGARQGGKFSDKSLMQTREVVAARKCPPGNGRQPVTGRADSTRGISAMIVDVHPGEIGYEPLVAVRFDIEDQGALQFLIRTSITPRAEKNPEFQRHVEPRQACNAVQLCPGEVVYAVPACLDQTVELLDPGLARIVCFPR